RCRGVRCSRFVRRSPHSNLLRTASITSAGAGSWYPKKCFEVIAATSPSSFDTVPTQAPAGNCPVLRLTNSECGKPILGVKWMTSPPWTMISMVSPSRILILSLMVCLSPNVADEPPDSETFDHSTRVDPGGSIRLVCLGTALPLANLLDRDRGVAPPPGPLLGVPSVQWAAKHRPDVAGKHAAHPQRLPVLFFSSSHRQTLGSPTRRQRRPT